MTGELALGPGEEFDVIRQLLGRWGTRAQGVGDDAAVLQLPRGDSLVASVDASVEGRHFRRGWLSARQIGYRAAAAALSDLAAMAARPQGMLIALVVPPAWRDELPAIADGIGDAADTARVTIRGGNVSGGGELLSITTTVLGSAYAPLVRSGARVGQRVYVTGNLGGANAELQALMQAGPHTAHRERFVHPVPRIMEALWLADRGASSAIDISDGLAADARHLASASGVCVQLDPARIPCCAGVSVESALRSGEEYELLITAEQPFDVAEFEMRFGLPLTCIGEITGGEPGSVRILGNSVAGAPGFDHFSR